MASVVEATFVRRKAEEDAFVELTARDVARPLIGHAKHGIRADEWRKDALWRVMVRARGFSTRLIRDQVARQSEA